MNRTLRLGLLTLLAALALSACAKQWSNPNIADLRKEDQAREADMEFCRQKAAGSDSAFDACMKKLGWVQE